MGYRIKLIKNIKKCDYVYSEKQDFFILEVLMECIYTKFSKLSLFFISCYKTITFENLKNTAK